MIVKLDSCQTTKLNVFYSDFWPVQEALTMNDIKTFLSSYTVSTIVTVKPVKLPLAPNIVDHTFFCFKCNTIYIREY